MSLFRKPIFSFSLFPRVIDGCLPFILYIIYIQDYFLYYILVCLSKVFQRTIFSFVLPFQRESVCKGKAFFCNLQIFSKVFFEKFFSEGFQKACGLPFLAPLHIRKVRYSVQQSALSPVASALPACHLQRLSLSKAVAKVRTFFIHATFTAHFFAKFFQILV